MKALDTIMETDDENKIETVVKDSITGEKKTVQWINEATKAKKSLTVALTGLKQIRERIDLIITMTEESENLQGFMDAINGSVHGTTGLIMCDDKNGWMDLNYCRHTCPSRCYKYNTGRWICTVLRCSSEKLTMCDEKDSRCQAFDIVMGFADRYTTLGNRVINEVKNGDHNELSIASHKMP